LVNAGMFRCQLLQCNKHALAPGHVVIPACRLTLRPEGCKPMRIFMRSRSDSAVTPATTGSGVKCPVVHG
jgi:hypothetical protein